VTEHDPADWVRQLSTVQKSLLERLVEGATIATAAASEYLSLRTANRRISELREQLGVATTRELVAVYRRDRR
jgi:DNA-binding NarL/FixJ family response regulator